MSGDRRARVAILLSGRGEIPARIVGVVTNEPAAAGAAKAAELGLATAVLPHRGLRRQEHEKRVLESLRHFDAEWICLAGYMRLLSPELVAAFPRRILNIHPSLLPAFPGLDAQRQALEHGVRVSGCTVHLVDDGLDSGPIVEQRVVPVEPDDTPRSLAARILVEEHRAYPEALRRLLTAQWRVEGRRIRWRRFLGESP